MTKHEQIINFIKKLKIGTKISVRQIAQELGVSEGTAYRAIKEAETLGYVNTIPRVGTVRIEKMEKREIEKLTFAEVVNIVDGVILGGRSGLHKTLNKFLIGAMEINEMKSYIEPGSLLIVGNRINAHEEALKNGAAVLISGGFESNDKVIQLANQLELPVISSSYDTFTIATLINKAIFKRLVKKDIILAEDIMVKEPLCLKHNSTVRDWKKLFNKTKHSRFPVIDDEKKVLGIVTATDVTNKEDSTPIVKVMTKNPITITEKASIAYAAHIMVWEGIEILPVIRNMKLIGVITRKDVIKAFQQMQNQPHVGETLDDLVTSHFSEENLPNGIKLYGTATSSMLNHLGMASCGALVTLVTSAGFSAIRKLKHMDTVTDSFVVFFTKPLQLEDYIEVKAQIIDIGRKSGKVDIEVYSKGQIVAKGLMSTKVFKK
ncbi:MAG: hypothetical protein PWQ82_219 [Thermosediminibacterales bacterium]|nr:hypothetical protein [Thermosediminibacterales bacterium]MDK2835241.1 hypothetical protein [Thermosediminibacterales bacterium]